MATYAHKLIRPLVALATVAALGLAGEAKATFQITFTSNATSITVTDGGAGDTNAGANAINFNQSVNGVDFVGSVLKTVSPSGGTVTVSYTSISVSNSSGATRSTAVLLEETAQAGGRVGQFRVADTISNATTIDATAGASGTISIVGPSTLTLTSIAAGSTLDGVDTPGDPANQLNGLVFTQVNALPTFGISNRLTIDLDINGAVTASGASTFIGAPAPLTAVAALSALPMFGGLRLMRRRNAVKA